MTQRNDQAPDVSRNRRPGVPMEHEPMPVGNAHWEMPERQHVTVPVLKRSGLEELTPVFGTTLPPRGLSGVVRRVAYRIPEHRASHWMLLIMADRIDAIEHNPMRLLTVAALVGGGFALRRMRTRRRRRFLFR